MRRPNCYVAKVLKIRKQALGEKSPDYAVSLSSLGTLYFDLGDYAKAERLYLQAAGDQEADSGRNAPELPHSLKTWPGCTKPWATTSRPSRSILQAVEIRKSVLGEKHPDYATSLNNLGGLYQDMGDYLKAEPLFKQALEIHKQTLGEKHPDYANSLNSLARTVLVWATTPRPSRSSSRRWKSTRKCWGKTPQYAGCLSNLAHLYRHGRRRQAEPLFQRGLEIKKQALGEKHPDYACSLNVLAGIYVRWATMPRPNRSLGRRWKSTGTLGEKHPDYAKT